MVTRTASLMIISATLAFSHQPASASDFTARLTKSVSSIKARSQQRVQLIKQLQTFESERQQGMLDEFMDKKHTSKKAIIRDAFRFLDSLTTSCANIHLNWGIKPRGQALFPVVAGSGMALWSKIMLGAVSLKIAVPAAIIGGGMGLMARQTRNFETARGVGYAAALAKDPKNGIVIGSELKDFSLKLLNRTLKSRSVGKRRTKNEIAAMEQMVADLEALP